MGRGRDVLAVVLRGALAWLGCLLAVVCVSPADPLVVVINEVLYDPEGADTGHEFVELYNGSDRAVFLAGWKLETGNGSYEHRWKLEWTGSPGDTIGAGGFFVIGEDGVRPPPDHATDLDLQNGPDGCRLTSPDGGRDTVGWGELIYGEYYETEPCEKASSGSSIGRDPDGTDTDCNSDDFTGFTQPSAGDYNHAPYDLAIIKAALSLQTSTAGPNIDIVCTVANCGTEACGRGATVFAAVGTCLDSATIATDLVPHQQIGVAVRPVHPGKGLHPVRVWQAFRPDRWYGNDTLVTTVLLPPSPVVVNEIMYRPGSHDCEWVELLNAGYDEFNLKHWTLEDAGGRSRPITNDDLRLRPGEYYLLVQDEDVFAMAHQDRDLSFARPEGGWPTLNDVDGPLDVADMVVIRDCHGTAVDSVAYRQRWSSPGISVERIDPGLPSSAPANWSPHYGSDPGSPGRPNSVSFAVGDGRGILALSPKAFTPDGNGVDDILAVRVSFPAACLVRLRVFDLGGNMVRTLIDGEVVEAARTTFWDGDNTAGIHVATGVYLVVLEARATGSGEAYDLKSPAILVRR